MMGKRHKGFFFFFPQKAQKWLFAVLAVRKVDCSLSKQNVWSLGIVSAQKVQPWLRFWSTES